MKINLSATLLFIALSVNCNVLGQTSTDQISDNFISYLNTLDNKDFEKSIEYLPIELFEFVPKKQMLSVFEEIFNNPEIIISYKNPKILEIQGPFEYQKKSYALIEYEATLKMKFEFGIEIESKEEKKDRLILQINNIKQLFGDDVVSFDWDTETFSIYEKKNAYAILYNDDPEWNFLVLDESSQQLLSKIIPTVILNRK